MPKDKTSLVQLIHSNDYSFWIHDNKGLDAFMLLRTKNATKTKCLQGMD